MYVSKYYDGYYLEQKYHVNRIDISNQCIINVDNDYLKDV